MTNIEQLINDSTALLKNLISTKSFSREEDLTAQILADFLNSHDITTDRVGNNIIAYNKYVDDSKHVFLR